MAAVSLDTVDASGFLALESLDFLAGPGASLLGGGLNSCTIRHGSILDLAWICILASSIQGLGHTVVAGAVSVVPSSDPKFVVFVTFVLLAFAFFADGAASWSAGLSAICRHARGGQPQLQHDRDCIALQMVASTLEVYASYPSFRMKA
eukprot:scaffold209103_cov28-Prasinocladus_malaysianus.AAC.1